MRVKVVLTGSIAAAGIALCATAGGAEAGGQVTTPLASASVMGQYAGQYDLYNLTDQVLTIEQAWTAQTTWSGIAPKAGTKIYPGQKLHFAVNANGTSGSDSGWIYLRAGDSKSFVVAVAKPSFSVGFRDSRVDYEPWRESSLDFGEDAFQVTPSGWNRSTLTVTSTKTRTHHLTSDQAGAQLEALREICATDSSADCSFEPTAYASALAAPRLAGGVLRNSGATTVDQAYSWTSTTTTSSQWGVQATLSARVFNLVETSFTSHYQQSITDSAQVGATTTVPVLPGYSSWLTYEAPVFRTTGNFTAKVAGNTWNITGVRFDIPKPDKDRNGTLTVVQLPTGDPRIPAGASVSTVS